MRNRTIAIHFRVTAQEKKKLTRLAEKCGLSLSEYLRQTAIGHKPKETPPLDYFKLNTTLTELYYKEPSPEIKDEIKSTLKLIQSAF